MMRATIGRAAPCHGRASRYLGRTKRELPAALGCGSMAKPEVFVMMRAWARALFLSFWLLASGAAADTLALPDNLVALPSSKGEALLLETRALEAYFPISVTFETQKNQAY